MLRLVLDGEQYFLPTLGFAIDSVSLKFDSELTMISATPLYLLPMLRDKIKGEKVYLQGLITRLTDKRQGEYQR